MTDSWRDVVAELAGPRGALRERESPPDWAGNVVAEVELAKPLRLLPGSTFAAAGNDSEHAWRVVAHDLALFRLMEGLKAAGWQSIEEVIDETTFVAAQDPTGTWWAIGVASSDGDLRGYIERDIDLDDRAFDRVAILEPIDTRDWASLSEALLTND